MQRKMALSILFVLFCLASTGAAAGETDIEFRGIGGQIGFVKPENIDATFGLGVQADMGTILGAVTFYPSIEFWRKSESDEGIGGSCDHSFTSITFNGNVRYYVELDDDSSVRPFFGGGLALALNWASTDCGNVDSSDSDFDIGLNLLGGIDFPLGETLTGFVEGKFLISDGNVLKLMAGITVPLDR